MVLVWKRHWIREQLGQDRVGDVKDSSCADYKSDVGYTD